MPTFTEVDAYLRKMFFAESYTELYGWGQSAVVFTASELLADHYPKDQITPRIVSLQVLFMLEGESEEIAKLRRQGVTDATIKDASVSLKAVSEIAPQVLAIFDSADPGSVGGGASVGEMI